MDIPKDIETHEMSSSTIWMKEGIVYSTPKRIKPKEVTAEQLRMDMARFKAITGNKKVCMVVEINAGYRPAGKEERELVTREINSIVKAMALITSSPVTRMVANLFLGFKPPDYPVKMFLNETDATNWVKQYL